MFSAFLYTQMFATHNKHSEFWTIYALDAFEPTYEATS